MTDIYALLPQRPPFLFVDALLLADRQQIIGVKTYDEFFPFYQGCQQQTVPDTILIESMVQCGGAGLTQMGLTENIHWGLAAVERARFRGSVKPNATVKMIVRNLKISQKILKQTGIGFCEDKAIVKATWFCLRLR